MLRLKLVESLRGMKYSQDSQIWLHSTDEMTSHMLTIITVKNGHETAKTNATRVDEKRNPPIPMHEIDNAHHR